MEIRSKAFKSNSRIALEDANLQRALGNLKAGFPSKRAAAIARLPEFDALRDQARDLKNHILEHLDLYLEEFEKNVTTNGGTVHWCRSAEDARKTILQICQQQDAKTVTKGKSMVSEEIALNEYLEANGVTPVETDLGEYILQLRNDHPSHIVAPAIHLTLDDVSTAFHEHHKRPKSDDPAVLMQEAREVLRTKFVAADVGITGANFLIAETGSTIICTNEGNGDLTQTLPKTHIVVSSIEKVVPTLEDMTLFLRLLARSATGQEFTVYNTLSTGPRRRSDQDGPENFHVVLVDNGRSDMVGTEFQEMLRCIRCSACMNHCPVYGAVGGHTYGWVYPGPMGSVLTPQMVGIENAGLLPNASTFCGKCEEVCPVRIPLPKLMRHWRDKEYEKHLSPASVRWGLGTWSFFARRPSLYRWLSRGSNLFLRLVGGKRGRISKLPLAGGWTDFRDLPAPSGKTFMQQWQERKQ
ncbi:putative L-lactate dehydrogenase, Iron-sulfur cluster-binding subunit YkgF [Marinobacterium lacunae]|uniref:Putative L-lactate dehydrogenase, Iron-sulfur cluster-binding subunit YkgF n=1 Tax=Marinobacterium lacunae TaxID=1232683 RepID=A0A081FXB6_9GAMM|nr:LutB/LldF family L-lactate oxidation iron-sulfur protein [Marinobacterium lacunae]KEA63171.1 putative L-lactate dehydrogenase, Iron-sulfur cluster-binding subunit YkgF [Marinobacterium lacunae]MBR9882665.1 iron-sulfur cluster-binding protein [Oceanospirillales bacterium]